MTFSHSGSSFLFHLRHPNSKTNQSKFWQILFLQKLYTFWLEYKLKGLAKVSHTFSPLKIVLPKLRPHCPATCPNTWRAEPRKKNTLSFFKRNFTPAKSRKQGVFFFRGCRGFARQWRNDSFIIRVLFKIHSNFVQNIPPKSPKRRVYQWKIW